MVDPDIISFLQQSERVAQIGETGFLQFLGSDSYQNDAGFRINHEVTFQYDAHGDIDD